MEAVFPRSVPGLKAGDVVQVIFENRAVTADGDSFTDVCMMEANRHPETASCQ
jgi:hypothetical protein